MDITLGSTDPTLAQTHFTLPDAVHSVDYDDEEAEMDELLERLGQAFPADASHSCTRSHFGISTGRVKQNKPLIASTAPNVSHKPNVGVC